MRRKCKYAYKSAKGYVKCYRDGSIRKGTPLTCLCPNYELSLWHKFINWLRRAKH